MKDFCFTVNNYDNYACKRLEKWFEKTANVTYIVVGKEIGKDEKICVNRCRSEGCDGCEWCGCTEPRRYELKKGTPHLQGYIQCKRKPTYTAFNKAVFGTKSQNYAHIMASTDYATAEQAAGYCKKGDKPSRRDETPGNELYYTEPADSWRGFELGELVIKTKQGQRIDLEEHVEKLMTGEMKCTDFLTPELAGVYHQYGRTFKAVEEQAMKKRHNKWREVHTVVLLGDAGVGKSSYVYKKHGYDNVFKIDSDCTPQFLCDGYDGEAILLIDDFKGWIRYGTMLDLTQGHPMKLNIKNGRTYKAWDIIYITSNVSPALWWKKGIGNNMLRRFTKEPGGVFEVETGGIIGRKYEDDAIKTEETSYDTYGDD